MHILSLSKHKLFPSIIPSSPNNLVIYYIWACPQKDGDSPQCDRFKPLHHELFTCWRQMKENSKVWERGKEDRLLAFKMQKVLMPAID